MDISKDRLGRARLEKWTDARLAGESVELARELLEAANRGLRISERMQANQLAAMMDDAAGKAFTFAMADQVFRPPSASRQARRFRDLLEDYGVPVYLPTPARLAIKMGELVSQVAPDLVMPRVASQLRRESASVILPAEPEALSRHIRKRNKAGMRLNLNQLGEAVLGEGEAGRRLRANLKRLADPDCDYISVKFSAIFSQIDVVGFEETLTEIKQRLRLLYRAAITNSSADGRPKFVNLDMEEYRDLRLTCDAFQQVLDESEFHGLEAGIVLQAYLPDAWPAQQSLNAWARERVAAGRAGIKIRLVKGANLAMERVDAEVHGWELAPYGSKQEVDANFKRMLHEGCRPENAAAVRLGVASHNLFDVAYGMLLRVREGVEDRVEFEMLEGMANHQARVVREAAGGVLLYAPVVTNEDFPSAIAYLVRRLDENTSPENFLHDLFGMKPGDTAWERQKIRFLAACSTISSTRFGPSRRQDRSSEVLAAGHLEVPYASAADTDWSLPRNVAWIRAAMESMRGTQPEPIPLQIGGEFVNGAEECGVQDPSFPGKVAYRHSLAGPAEIDRALACAVDARESWRRRGPDGRSRILLAVAAELGRVRGEAITTMVMDAGKSVVEGDVEVSEAVDFANYYARSLHEEGWFDGSSFEPLGTVVVTPPWNFPFAIPCGSVLAPLAAGCTVILKPAPETVASAWVMVNALWKAGVPKEVLQFLPCPDNEIGRRLITDDRVGSVVLTGAYETARMFLSWKPEMRLIAETSGKNALIISAAADPDLAVKDLVRSAFGHAGQKCSAASLGIIEAELYDDPDFMRRLKDAAESLPVGSSWQCDRVVTPVVRPPGPELVRALTTLDPGETWLLKPQMVDGNPCLWSPGIRLGVDPDGWFRRTECFGPVLGLIRARDLEHAIRIQNESEFGLTGGIHSLDPQEIRLWKDRVEVGNAYINRPITGAIVRRQPFGGWKRSSIGPGAKAGGPNYVAQFGIWGDESEPRMRTEVSKEVADLLEEIGDESLRSAAESDAFWLANEFGVSHDPTGLRCESNDFRYRPVARVLIRAPGLPELGRMVLAATAAGCVIEISIDSSVNPPTWAARFHCRIESEESLASHLHLLSGRVGSLRCESAGPDLRVAALDAGIRLIHGAPVANGRVELLACFYEQVVSETLHRHGSVLPTCEEVP
jgi:RHH-type proline utilization regulon transcriptional repressor/proline dehydrogenase/delta 1-pyrroline-5-carboxylate dehydrogenase